MRSVAPRVAAALVCSAVALTATAGPAQADSVREEQWHLKFLNVTEAHKHSRGDGVTVAVIDTGVDRHPDLRTNLLPGTSVRLGATGHDTRDRDGHGTRMAGLIAAHGRSGDDGALGIAPGAKILPIVFGDGKATSGIDTRALGIQWALTHNASVICMASGGGDSTALRSAVQSAIASDVVVVAAGGNYPQKVGVTAPAMMAGVVAAAAIDKSGKRAKVSVKGPELSLAAPGEGIVSTDREGGYGKGTGTSPSTAIIAGAAALVRSKFPDLSAKEVIHRLTATATDKGPPGRDNEYGYGVLNLVAALTADVPPLPDGPTASPTATVTSPTSPGPPGDATTNPPAQADKPGGSAASVTTFMLVAAVIAGGALGLIAVVIGRRRTRRTRPTS